MGSAPFQEREQNTHCCSVDGEHVPYARCSADREAPGPAHLELSPKLGGKGSSAEPRGRPRLVLCRKWAAGHCLC